MRGGDRGETISIGQADKSLLIQAVRHEVADFMMPPNAKKLDNAEIADLEAWVNLGAHDPRRETVSQASNRMSLDQARTFWSFQPVQQIVPPKDSEDRWSWTSIDAFLHAKWKEKETTGSRVSPVSDADRRTLIRRASFDFTGLPPSSAEINTYLNEETAGDYGRSVDRMLVSLPYGYCSGRPWYDSRG